MSYIKRNINLVLFIICILCIGYLLTLTTYYETNFDDISDKYHEQLDSYESLVQDIEERERKLNETSYELSRKSQDKEKLNELYSEVSSEKDQLSQNLQTVQSQLASARKEVKDKNELLNIKNTEIITLTKTMQDAYAEIGNEIDDLYDELDDRSNMSRSDLDELFEDVRKEIEVLDRE